MKQNNNFGIDIPKELQEFRKEVKPFMKFSETKDLNADFGVKLVKDSAGSVTQAIYYADNGEISKRIFYKGPFVSSIEHYRFGKMNIQEMFENGLLQRKSTYDKNGLLINSLSYKYNNEKQIISIKKNTNDKKYEIIYGYDELNRVNSREFLLNAIVLEKQKFKFDILDRIVEYEDKKQKITVYKINVNNELIKYSIRDKSGNNIEVYNKFLYADYIGTEIELNGHKTTIKNKGYLSNYLLKKPYSTEDDFNMALSELLCTNTIQPLHRERHTDISDNIIDINKERVLPISIRKLHLLKQAM